MSDEQSTQSVKDILEDIKKAMFGNNTNDSKAVASDHGKGDDHKKEAHLKGENLQQPIADDHEDDDDILHLKEEYSPETAHDEDDYEEEEYDDESDDDDENDEEDDIPHLKEEYSQHNEDNILHLKEEYSQSEDSDKPDNYLHSDNTSNKVGLQNDDLILKENIEEIRALLGKMQNELQQQQQSKSQLTVEELVVSLLKPELSEWLNKNLCKLVKSVVEKEIKDIINNK